MQSWVICRGCLTWPQFTWLGVVGHCWCQTLPHPSPMGCLGRGRRPWPCRKFGVPAPPRLQGLLPFAPKCQEKQRKERGRCPCSGDKSKLDDGGWQRVSLSWLGLEGILLEVISTASMPCRRWYGLGWGKLFSDPWTYGRSNLRHNPSRTALPGGQREMPSLGPGCWSLYPGGCWVGWSLQPALPCALVLSAPHGPAALGEDSALPEPSHSGHTGCERQREGPGLPPPHPLPRQPCCWRWTQWEGDDCACGWSTSWEPGRGLQRGGGGLLDGESLSHLHLLGAAMETVRAPSPVPAVAAAAA